MSTTKPVKLPTKNVIQGTLFATPAQLRQWTILKPTVATSVSTQPPQNNPSKGEVVGESSGNGGGGSGVDKNNVISSIWWIKKLLKEAEESRPVLPESLESIPKVDYFPNQRHRWNTNEEIASLLISFERHEDWLSKEVKIRPKSGSMLLYSRKRVRYRRDGYCWKKRKDGKTTREDHMKLKVQGTECIYGCYVHSAILPTFHRRCYWLLQNPDIVLVHYLNVPYSDDNKLMVTPSLSYCADKKEWTKEELVSQLKPMFYSENEPDLNNELEISTAETVEAMVQQLMEKQRAKSSGRPLDCACDKDKKCSHTSFHRVISPKTHSRSNNSTATANSTTSITTTSTQVKVEDTTTTAAATLKRVVGGARPGSVILAPCRPILQQDGKHHEVSITGSGGGSSSTAATSLILNLSQLQGGGGLLILNSAAAASGVGLTSASVTPVTFLCGQDTATTVRTTTTAATAMDTSESAATVVTATTKPVIIKKPQQLKTVKVEVDERIECPLKRDVQFSAAKESDLCSVMEESKDLPLNLFEDALSHDDIQRTLLANMPNSGSNKYQGNHTQGKSSRDSMIVDLNPMDFIDNDLSTPDEEVFSMDTFDILSDLPSLDDLNPAHSAMDYREGTANITDYSPDWCYTEGGVKVLVTGPWYSSSSPYTVLFDGVNVPTTLVQSGVLRCYSPAHDTGLVTLQVACEGFVISNSVFFEYRQRQAAASVNSEDWFSVEDSTLKLSLLERLEIMETKLTFNLDTTSAALTTNSVVQNASEEQKSLEERLVSLCQKFMSGSWSRPDDVSPMLTTTCSDLTLLHLASALGLPRLVCTLLHWRNENSSLLLEREVDAMSQDKRGCTPLMWACALGFTDVALLLYQWNRAAIKVSNNRGATPLTVAADRGHDNLVEQIEKLESQLATKSSSSEGDLNSALKLEDFFLGNPATDGTTFDQMLTNITSLSRKLLSSISKNEPPKSSSGTSSYAEPSGESQSYSLHLNESSLLSFLNVFQAKESKKETSPTTLSDSGEKTKNPSSNLIADIIASDEELDSQFPSAVADGLDNRRDSCSSCDLPLTSEADNRVLALAEHIIAAMPDRIKAASDAHDDDVDTTDLDMGDTSPAPLLNDDFSFDHSYRYCEAGTPVSSLSPASSSCLQSPGSSFALDSPSPPPTTADFCEFFQASGKIMEKDFSKLTLSDREQRELYEAAQTIQKAYRSYKGRKREQEKEKAAATLIQTYYRRYKQYMYYRQMTRAAQLIQSQFRHYCEHKRFKKCDAADCISPAAHHYWTTLDSPSTSTNLKRTYSQRRQHQAARKIQQFLRQSKNNMWDYLQGKAIAERTCISCRKREASGGNSESSASAPKIPGTAF